MMLCPLYEDKMTTSQAIKFKSDLTKLELTQSDFAYLIDRTPRCISFYCTGKRGIPKAVWVKLHEFEQMDIFDLWKLLPEQRRG